MNHGWPLVRLQEIAADIPYPIGDGDHGQIKPAMYSNSGVPYIRVADIGWGHFEPNGLVHIPESVHEANLKSELRPGDILIAKTGATIGKCCVVPSNVAKANTTSSVGKISVDQTRMIPEFLLYWFLTPEFQKYLWSISTRAAQPGFNIADMKLFKVPVPPLDEQQRVVHLLDEAFEGMAIAKANSEMNIQNARALFESHLQNIFTQGGASWRAMTLQELFEIGSSKRVLKSDWKTKGVPFYRGREITKLAAKGVVDNDLFISETQYAQLEERFGAPKPGDVMITAIGTIGNAYIVGESDRFYFKDASVLWMKKSSEVDSNWIKFWLRSKLFLDQLDRGNGATVDTLTVGKLRTVTVLVPPLDEQRDIAEKLEELHQATERLSVLMARKTMALQALKQSLISVAFSGN